MAHHLISPPSVKINNCDVKGLIDKDIYGSKYFSFIGIPYAEPPIGNLRFKDPEPITTFNDTIFKATEEKCLCPGNYLTKISKETNEDCLYLNVYTPVDIVKGTKLPVMLYVHDCAFTQNIDVKNDRGPDYFMKKNVILVTCEYRCGILGCLHFNDPRTEVPGNAGLKDIIVVLQWIKKNICVFGGNPLNVTVFGNGYGAVATHLLLFSPLSKNLFHKAIIQSGSILSPWVNIPRYDEIFADCLGYEGLIDKVDILKFLQNQPIETIIEGQQNYFEKLNFYGTEMKAFGPTVETFGKNRFLINDPKKLLKTGEYHKVPLIMGFGKADGTVVEAFTKLTPGFEDYSLVVSRNIQKELQDPGEIESIGEKISQLYFADESKQNHIKMCTDLAFAHGIRKCIKEHASFIPVYYYTFGCQTGLNTQKNELIYGDDVRYLISRPNTKAFVRKKTIEYECVNLMTTLWTNFALNSDPNPVPALPMSKWRVAERDFLLCLDISNKVAITPDPGRECFRKLDRYYRRALKRPNTVYCLCNELDKC